VTGRAAAAWADVTPNFFAMPFGVIGLAAAWSAAAPLGAPRWVPSALLVVAACLWLLVSAAYLAKLRRRPAIVAGELRDPAAGPFAAFAPIGAMLLGGGLVPFARLPGQVIVALGLAATAGFGAWWTADRVLAGPIRLEQVHSAYLIPFAVGGIEAASAAHAAGWAPLARLCLGAGLFGWACFGALTFARLLLCGPPPSWLQPTLAIDAAVAAAAGVALFNVSGIAGGRGDLGYAVAGYGLAMAAVQVRLLPRYLRLPFTPGFWVFAFVAAVTATDLLRWLPPGQSGGFRVLDVAALAAATLLIAAIAAGTCAALVSAARYRAPRQALPEQGTEAHHVHIAD
jgi:tellurite resistance protein